MTTASTPFRPFCDGCGSRFEDGQLRSTSRFCHSCGQELLPFIRAQLASQTLSTVPPTPETPPVTPAKDSAPPVQPTPTPLEETLKHSEEETEQEVPGIAPLPSGIATSSTRGRKGGDRRSAVFRARMRGLGKGRGHGRGRGRGRGAATASSANVPITPKPNGSENTPPILLASGPGLRTMDRPDYSVTKRYKELLSGKPGPNIQAETEVPSPSSLSLRC